MLRVRICCALHFQIANEETSSPSLRDAHLQKAQFAATPTLLRSPGSTNPAARPRDRSSRKKTTLVERLQAAGYRGFLIGETLMRADDPVGTLGQLTQSVQEARVGNV